jgi:rhodanese-related sulfurtransferase
MVAALAGGQELTREQVLEGVLWQDVSPARGRELVESGGIRIVDVRSPEETAQGIIPGAMVLPIEELEARWREIPNDGKRTLVYCAGGVRSAHACEFLASQGYSSLYNLEGGFTSWSGPVARP